MDEWMSELTKHTEETESRSIADYKVQKTRTHNHTKQTAHTHTHTASYAVSPWSLFPPAVSPVSSVPLGPRGHHSRWGWCGSTGTLSSGRTTPGPGGSRAARSGGRTGGYSAHGGEERRGGAGGLVLSHAKGSSRLYAMAGCILLRYWKLLKEHILKRFCLCVPKQNFAFQIE